MFVCMYEHVCMVVCVFLYVSCMYMFVCKQRKGTSEATLGLGSARISHWRGNSAFVVTVRVCVGHHFVKAAEFAAVVAPL